MTGSRAVAWLLAATVAGMPGMAAAQGTPGKYLCYTAHVAGIQVDGSGNVRAGSFRPNESQFFLTLSQATPMPGCPNLFAKDSLANWYSCHAKFQAQVGSGPLLRGDSQGVYIGTGLAVGAYLQFDGESGTFVAYAPPLQTGGSFYATDGKCTKAG